ncbi:MAG: PorP/SprF family type IX secretion system membrane protein [Saprospiraceae bacterium]
MKKLILLFLSIVFITGIAFGQQLPIFSQYQEGDHFTNPAMLSNGLIKYELNSTASIVYRNQWTEVKDAPRTALGRFEHWNEDMNLFYGGSLIFDQTGPTSFIGVFGKVGYGIEFNRDWMLSIALSGGLVQYRIKGAELNFLEEGDIAQSNATRIYPDAGLGAVLYYKKRFFVGVSSPQIFGLTNKFSSDENDFNIQRVRHYYGVGGAIFPINNNWVEVSAYGKYVPNVPFLAGVNLRYDFNNIFWVGAGGSTAGAMTIEGGLIFGAGDFGSPLRVGYGITNYFSEFNLNFGLVHELKAAYSW